MRTGSDPNFCPPVEEGLVYTLQDENGDEVSLEFLGLVLYEQRRFGFFFPVSEEEPALSSGEVIVLEVVALDDEGQPDEFEWVDDDALADQVYEVFKRVAADLYDFEG